MPESCMNNINPEQLLQYCKALEETLEAQNQLLERYEQVTQELEDRGLGSGISMEDVINIADARCDAHEQVAKELVEASGPVNLIPSDPDGCNNCPAALCKACCLSNTNDGTCEAVFCDVLQTRYGIATAAYDAYLLDENDMTHDQACEIFWQCCDRVADHYNQQQS